MPEMPRVAFVIDALASFTGAERVLATVLELYPDAPIFTLAYDPAAFEGRPISARRVRTSWIQRLPRGAALYRNYLPFLPTAVEGLDLRGYDVVISLSYAVAHGVLCRPDQLHISYTFAPLRYAWQSSHEYFQRGLVGAASTLIMHYLRLWDFSAAARVDHFAAISRWTAACIQRAYRRSADVIYPPVETGRFHPALQREDYYVAFSRLVRHKKLELVVQAFSHLDLPLVIIGAGPERRRLEAMAGQNIRFVGWQTDEAAAEILGRAKALVHAAEEDFGLVMAEAQAAGCPVIGYAGGAAREIMVEGETGLLFHEQTAEAIAGAVLEFAKRSSNYRLEKIIQNAQRFGKARFKEEFLQMAERASTERSGRFPTRLEPIRLGGR